MSVLALLVLYDGVEQVFKKEGRNTSLCFGEKEATKQINQGPGRANRVIFIPGDRGFRQGMVGPAKYPGNNPRSLNTLKEAFRVQVWAVNPTNSSERAQYEAVRLLQDDVIRIMEKCDPGGLRVLQSRYMRETVECNFGMMIEMQCEIDAMIPDKRYPVAEHGVGKAYIKVELPSGVEDPNPGPVVTEEVR